MSDTDSNKNKSENRHHKHEYPIDALDHFFMSPYGDDCTEACIQEYKKSMDYVIRQLQLISLINQSVKVKEDGTIPYYSIASVMNCNEPFYDGENMQDIFKINLSDLKPPKREE